MASNIARESDIEQGKNNTTSDAIETKEDALAQRAATLRRITTQVHSEADAQQSLLSSLEHTISSARSAVSSVSSSLPKAVSKASNRQLLVSAGGIASAFILVYSLIHR